MPDPRAPALRPAAGARPAEATRLLPVVRPLPSGAPQRRIARLADRVPLASVYLLIITLVVFQRFVVPGTVVSVALPVAFLVLIGLAARGQLVADVSRVALYFAFLAFCLLCTVVTSAGTGPEPSISSLLLLLVLLRRLPAETHRHRRNGRPDVPYAEVLAGVVRLTRGNATRRSGRHWRSTCARRTAWDPWRSRASRPSVSPAPAPSPRPASAAWPTAASRSRWRGASTPACSSPSVTSSSGRSGSS